MVRFKSSRGFVMPIMVAGFVVVGLLAAIGIINLFKTPNTSSKTASQTIQSNTVQRIADSDTWKDCSNNESLCGNDYQCVYRTSPKGTPGYYCLVKNDFTCHAGDNNTPQKGNGNNDQGCVSGICISGECKAEKLTIDNKCGNDNDCKSGWCSDEDGKTCQAGLWFAVDEVTNGIRSNRSCTVVPSSFIGTPEWNQIINDVEKGNIKLMRDDKGNIAFWANTPYDPLKNPTLLKPGSGEEACKGALEIIKGAPPGTPILTTAKLECVSGVTAERMGYKLCAFNPQNKDNFINSGFPDTGVPFVELTFTKAPTQATDDDKGNTVPYNELFYCLKTNTSECEKDDLKKVEKKNKATIEGDTIRFFPLCGNGNKELKTKCRSNGKDFFHPGKIYRVSLYGEQNPNSRTLISAAFYVTHYYPTVVEPVVGEQSDLNMSQINGHTPKIPDIKVVLKGRNIMGGTNDSDSNTYNDYSIRVIGLDNDYKSEPKCVYVPPGSNDSLAAASASTGNNTIHLDNPAPQTFDNPVYLASGEYILRIKDGKDGNFKIGNETTCKEGDFTYWDIPFTIEEDKSGSFSVAIRDPKKTETNPNLGPPPEPAPICYNKDKKGGYCTGIPTALGFIIHTEPERFVGDIFTIVLSIGGIAAIGFFIQAGYKLMTSGGNKEKVGAAREQITAAIMGLLFIILSITILEFIGINILHIPGFK